MSYPNSSASSIDAAYNGAKAMPPPLTPPGPSPTVQSVLRLAASPEAFAELAPQLGVTGSLPRQVAEETAHPATDERTWLAREGFASLPEMATRTTCRALVQAVEALRARDLPASFLYAFDEVWALGRSIGQRISSVMGREYRLVEDIWAWHVLPGSGRGWPPHRGVAHERLDRKAPEVINAWAALTDASADRACMHAVPLDDDPSYPDALDSVEAPLSAVRALPATEGHVLFWNANVLHWGGRCAARAVGPRVSCSFTLCRADAASRFPSLVLLAPLEHLDLAARMDAVAKMILVYGQPGRDDVSAVVYEWATVTQALTTRFGAPRSP